VTGQDLDAWSGDVRLADSERLLRATARAEQATDASLSLTITPTLPLRTKALEKSPTIVPVGWRGVAVKRLVSGL
jgi:hypothetical protein